MKKMLFILAIICLISSCRKTKCWECTQTFTYPNGSTQTFDKLYYNDLTEKEIRVIEKTNTYIDETEKSEFKCREK